MRIIDWLGVRKRESPRNSLFAELLRYGNGLSTESGVDVNESSAMRVATAWRCVSLISGAIGSMPFDLIRRTSEIKREPAKGHWARTLLTGSPNGWQSSHDWRKLMQVHLLLRGNAYSVKVKNSSGAVVQLLPVHPDSVVVRQSDETLRLEYDIAHNGKFRRYSDRDVLHIRGLSLDGIAGLSVLSYMREAIGVSLAAEQAGSRLMRQGAFFKGILSTPNRLSEQAMKNLSESWTNQWGGAENSGKTPILEHGLEYKQLGLTAADAEFVSIRTFQRSDISMFFGVPSSMIGIADKGVSTGAANEAISTAFVTYTLNDWLSTWEQALERSLLPPDSDLNFRFFPNGLLRGDTTARWDSYTRALQWGVLSPNEVRGLEDINPRPGGDVYYPPPNMTRDEDAKKPGQHTSNEDADNVEA